MKYFYLIIFLAIFSNSNAQLPNFPFIDSTSEWYTQGEFFYAEFFHCNQSFAIEKSSFTYFIKGDTSIALKKYYKLYSERINLNYCLNNPAIQWGNSSTQFVRYIREENHKIYTYEEFNGIDLLLRSYDNISIGDSLYNDCLVVSIDTLFLLNQPYLKYNCACDSQFLIQAIGTKKEGLFSIPDCGTGIEGSTKNMCYRKNGFVIKVNPNSNCISSGDSSIYVSAKNITKTLNNKIYPNPIIDVINIELPENLSGSYTLYSLDGKRVLSKHFLNCNKLTVDFSNFIKGIYFLIIQSEKGGLSYHRIIKI
ncbi:MAG: T9SS type A sorting domain-containing protein [Saprospiraceae bacterium]|nr:T9SS type A sorting domain-containing protein [Saprospiraceae bacterium]